MADAAAVDSSTNPLLTDFDFTPFDAVQPAHVRLGIRLDVDRLKAVKDSADLRAAVEDVQPEKVKFYLRLGQSKPIYEAFNAIRNSSKWDSLSDARKRVVEGQIKDAVLGGVALEDEQREKFNQIQQELEKLTEKFSENVLDATKKFEKLISDKKEIDGLPASALGLAAQTAVSKGHENTSAENGPWVITLYAPSFMPVMQNANQVLVERSRKLSSSSTRGCGGDGDNDKGMWRRRRHQQGSVAATTTSTRGCYAGDDMDKA